MQRSLRAFLIATLFVTAGAALTAGRALADDKQASNADNRGTTPKTKVYDFTGDTIEGDRIKPDGSTVYAVGFGTHGSLIRIRTSFIKEIVKSAEDL